MILDPVKSDGIKIKSNYCFKIDLVDKTRHFFGMEFSKDANNWTKILRRSKKTYAEIIRTEDTKLRKNVDKLVWYFRNQQADEVIKYCKSEFEIFSLAIRLDKTKPELFIKVLTNAYLNSFDVPRSHPDPGCYPKP